MKSNRHVVLDFIYSAEGGFVIRDTEPGGAGNRGIAFERFKAWWHLQKRTGEPTFDDLKNQPQADADALYGKFFMDPCHFDDLPLGVDYVVLDGFINGGGLIILQHALGMKDDHPEVEHHIFGPVTLWGATHRDPRVFINKLCDVRRARNAVLRLSNKPIKTGSQKTWEQVWNERTEVVRKRALAMVK
jgi:lysozyme family protein